MNKLANMRHWSEGMGPRFGMSRPNMNMTPIAPQQQKTTPHGVTAIPPTNAADAIIHYSFNVPFASDLAGPNTEDIVYATPDAVLRWTHPEDAADDVPIYELPVHANNVMNLRKLCREISAGSMPIEAQVTCSQPKRVKGQVVNVCLSGSPEAVHRARDGILNQTPMSLRCAVVDIAGELIIDTKEVAFKSYVVEHLDELASFCGVDIFLLGPKVSSITAALDGAGEVGRDQRWRVAIYGDLESCEHAKTRILIYIDRLLGRIVDTLAVELSLHTVICGRSRKNIKLIESATNTAIYFPPPFAQLSRYLPPGAQRRLCDEVFITGDTAANIQMAKQKIHELVTRARLFVKDAVITPAKLDSILMGRLEKARKIMETNGTFILFRPLASQQNVLRVQGTDLHQVERTVKEIMALTSQFYSTTWWVQPAANMQPSPADIQRMLPDICANSDADVAFDKLTFSITGSDDAVKDSLMIIAQMRWVRSSQYQIRVKMELANEHKEFVSGKKNGKINKIMGQSGVQIIFDGFNEYNFNIDVCAGNYEAMKTGLTLVEQEMPASISFHVPDQYHKRIIGIGGQHIQRIMKKHSVFVKFSNAMDRGGVGREEDDMKVDNVICRTPARNAQNLELVKAEILDMVDRADSEFTSQTVTVDRLYHRELIARMTQIEELEKKWNCKITFPSTEQASDEITVSGPEWQVPHCVDEFLGMVPDNHELVLASTPQLVSFFDSPQFRNDLAPKLKAQYVVEVHKKETSMETSEEDGPIVALQWTFTRNNAGGVRDAIDFLIAQLAAVGIEAQIVRGAIPRPKSDSFEESLQYFDSKLLQHAPPVSTDSPTKPTFGDEVARERSTIFDKLRKPGSMGSISSFLDRRKNSSHSSANSLFKNGSGNVSKSSLISIESTRSFNADRNPWNDSGVNLTDEDNASPWASRHFNGLSAEHKVPFNPAAHPGDATPKYTMRGSSDSGRPSTSHSANSIYPVPIGPPR